MKEMQIALSLLEEIAEQFEGKAILTSGEETWLDKYYELKESL